MFGSVGWQDVIGGATQLAGGVMNAEAQAEAAQKNAQWQEKFAKMGLRWRVKDAKAAGIHPLAALGASSTSFTPSFVGDTSVGDAISGMGQDISRAVSSTQTQAEKEMQTLQIQSLKGDVQGKELDNQIRAKQLQNMSLTSPPFPGGDNFIPGQTNSGLVKVNPAERTVSAPGRPAQEAGWTPDVGFARTDTGLVPVPSKDVKERIEDQAVPEMMWAARNYLIPNITGGGAPPKHMLPKGADNWQWNYDKQEWQPIKGKPRRFGQGTWWKVWDR